MELSYKKIKEIIATTIRELADETFAKVNADIVHGLIDMNGSGRLEVRQNGFKIFFNDEHYAFLEFGTGNQETVIEGKSAAQYLTEVEDWWEADAKQFIKNKRGQLGAHPFLYPNMLWAFEELPKRIDKNIQAYFDSL